MAPDRSRESVSIASALSTALAI